MPKLLWRFFNEPTRVHTLSYRLSKGLVGQSHPGPAADAAARPRRRQERHEAHEPAQLHRGRGRPGDRRLEGRPAEEPVLVPQPAREPGHDDAARLGRRAVTRAWPTPRSGSGCGRRSSTRTAATRATRSGPSGRSRSWSSSRAPGAEPRRFVEVWSGAAIRARARSPSRSRARRRRPVRRARPTTRPAAGARAGAFRNPEPAWYLSPCPPFSPICCASCATDQKTLPSADDGGS